MNILTALGIILVMGHLGGWAASKLKFPRITGYLIVGFLLNPSVLNLIPKAAMEKLEILPMVVLGVISYHIGGGLRLQSLQNLRRVILWISFFQSFLPWAFSILLISFIPPLFINLPQATFWHTFFPMSIVLGAVACSSAPAVIVALIHEGKAQGPVTTTTLAVLALTDALAVIAFAIGVGIARPLSQGENQFSLYSMLIVPAMHLIQSFLLGLVMGYCLIQLLRWVKTSSLGLVLIWGFIFLSIGLEPVLGISFIVTNMVTGFVVSNRAANADAFNSIQEIGDLLFTAFFVLNGLFFDLSGMKNAGLLTIFVILARWSGKYWGARIGARIGHAPEAIEKYPGVILLPKAGLTLGLAFMARDLFPTFGILMFDALLASTMINMLITPPLARFALIKSREASF